MPLKKFIQKLESKKTRIGVIGLGYVGLPLAVAFGKAGFSVTGIDVDEKKIQKLHKGESYVLDVRASDIQSLVSSRKFKATSDYSFLENQDAIIICVPTPLNKTKEPDISCVIDATKRICKYLSKGQLIVLESTTYPGTTEEVMLPMLESSKLKVEKDFFLAFSPERVDPGNKKYDTISIPKVVGGVGKNSVLAVSKLYGTVIQKIIPVSSAKTAEMVKLLENTFRSVNIGLINEMALLCRRLNIDIWEVIEAAKTKPFGFMPFYPGPGIGGHCLPIDPIYLSWKSRVHGFEAKMIELASAINQQMPQHVVERITLLLNKNGLSLKKAPVLVLGVSYKKNIDDLRESPALDVIENLIQGEALTSYHDPFINSLRIDEISLDSKVLTPAFIRKQACVVILTDHSDVDYEMIVNNAKLILDTRNVLRGFAPLSNLHFL